MQQRSGNANMEVTEARGTFNTLNNRLNNSDSVDDNLKKQIDNNSSRISNIITNATETDGNAELIDVRVDGNGISHISAGDSIRSITNILEKEKVDLLKEVEWEIGGIDTNTGELQMSETMIRSKNLFLAPVSCELIFKAIKDKLHLVIWLYDENMQFQKYIIFNDVNICLFENAYILEYPYFRITLTNKEYTTMADTSIAKNLIELSIVAKAKQKNIDNLKKYNKSTVEVEWIKQSLNIETGILSKTTNPSQHTSNLLKIDSDILNIYVKSGYGYRLFYYNADMSFNSYTENYFTDNEIIPLTKFIRFNVFKNDFSQMSDDDTKDKIIIEQRFYGNKAEYNGKKISVLGDSISTFLGYSENTQGGTLYPTEYYPTGDIADVSQMWWEQLIERLNGSLGAVSAVSRSSYVAQDADIDIPEMSNDDRINRLGENGIPDIIILAGGTNDCFAGTKIDVWDGDIDIENLETKKSSSVSSGIALTIRKLQNKYQNARIIVLSPKICQTKSFTYKNYIDVCNLIKNISKALGCEYIDLRDCGIKISTASDYTIDGGIHPNAKGMKILANEILKKIK